MKHTILLALALGACTFGAQATATNYALSLTPQGHVDCGRVEAIEGLKSYTIQLWLNPSQWTAGAQVLSLGSQSSLKLGQAGTVDFNVADATLAIASADLAAGQWAQITIVCDNGNALALVNGAEAGKATLGPIEAQNSDLVIGNGFDGRIDDLRLWSDVLSSEHNYFIKNTINRWNPQIDKLVAYYKFDQTACPDIVEQTAIWSPDKTYNNHGTMSAGVSRTEVTDNPAMKYRLNGAYTANERFYDRAIPAEQYLLSNDLIILGIQSFADGHLEYSTPCNHATLNGATRLASFEGRDGVMAFDGNATVDCGTSLWKDITNEWAFEAMLYIDEWVDGAVIFEKMTADGKGVKLSMTANGFTMDVDGHTYSICNTTAYPERIPVGKWFHIGFEPNNNPAGEPRDAFNFFIDGNANRPRPSDVVSDVFVTPTVDASTPVLIGKGFKGKMDNVAFWKYRDFTGPEFNSHRNNGPLMPGLGKNVTSFVMQRALACYEFDRADNPGFDSYSQDHWLEIMRSAYDGNEGYEIRISVKTPSGYNDSNLINLINNASWRKKFAEDLAVLSAPYDGVELDLEWVYNWSSYGLLAEEIRSKLPAGKSFMVSTHNVSYSFPKDKMQYVDGFTFQQYGPQKGHFYYSEFESKTKAFVNYGYPKDKIVCSYSTTTSRGYVGNTASTAISGVRSGFFDDSFVPDPECDVKTLSNNTYYFCGPLQTYKRARYVVDNDLRGIFYWDMGNDVPVDHKYNMAKWCSYALNSNVEPRVTKVDINHNTGIADIAVDTDRAIELRQSTLLADGAIEVYNLAGIVVARGAGSLDIDALPAGVYLARSGADTLKFVK